MTTKFMLSLVGWKMRKMKDESFSLFGAMEMREE